MKRAKTEELFTCPTCGTSGFTARGLKAHRCDGRNRKAIVVAGAKPLTLATLDEPAPFVGEDEDAMLGRQLTEQWKKVVGGQREQLIFGAMMLKLRARFRDSARGAAQGVDSARGANSATRGPTTKGTGLKGWLKEFAPAVAESTAYRLMDIAEGVQAEFRLGAKVDLEALLAAQVENLDGTLAKKRAEIERCIEGQSQRQLLLTFGKEMKRKGGAQQKGDGDDSEPQKPAGWSDAQWAAYLALDPEMREAEDEWREAIIHLEHQLGELATIHKLTRATKTHLAQLLRQNLALLK